VGLLNAAALGPQLSSAASPLIDADDLHARLSEPGLRIADVRWYLGRPNEGRAAFDRGHLPGAIFVDLEMDLAQPDGFGAPGRHPLPSVTAFAVRLGELGFSSGSSIVAYDDAGGTIAARLWWMLDALGHADVRVLDGGIEAWIAAGYELTTETQQIPPATYRRPGDPRRAEWPRVIDRGPLAAAPDAFTVLDARAPERYRGEVEPVDPQAGHIPGALNAPTAGNLDSSRKLRNSDQLREIYEGFRGDGERPTVVSCGSGVTACHDALAMRVAGLPDPILYVGSFSDWSRSGMPVVAGADPR